MIIDMDRPGHGSGASASGEWHKWNESAFWGAPFIWSALHDFGGTDGLKGNMTYAASIPTAAIDAGAH